MNLIKTKLRNTMTTTHLNQLLALSMTKKTVFQYDFKRAATKYHENHRNCAGRTPAKPADASSLNNNE